MSRHLAGLPRICAALSLLLAAPGLALAAPAIAQAQDNYSHARIVRLSLVEGDVQVLRPADEDGKQEWEEALVNLPIQQGFRLATGRGRAEIEFESGATARIAENTVVEFTELALLDGGRITRLRLVQGTATFYANLSREDTFNVATPQLEVSIPDDARFRVDSTEESSTVAVFKGDVEVSSRAGTNKVTKNRSLIYRATEPDRVEVVRSDNPDEWDRWVANRDETVQSATNASLSYFNSSDRYGIADLTSYGAWNYYPGYGNCWQPYGVGFGWAPFTRGQWIFYPGLGWTWVSYERWGWWPYHSGQWLFLAGTGWLWSPGGGRCHRCWDPAPVHWVDNRGVIGWVPRSPRDRPGRPDNIQHGVIVPTSRGGRDRLHDRRLLGADDHPDVLDRPPQRIGNLTVRGNRGGGPQDGGTREGGGGIVYDPRSRTYVNDPNRPVRPTPTGGPVDPNFKKEGIRRQEEDSPPPVRGFSGDVPQRPPAQVQPPSPRGPAGTPTGPTGGTGFSGTRGRDGMQDSGQRQNNPPPPRVNNPPPPPTPRVNNPPPSPPPPRVYTPPPPPPPRVEPRPSPPPPSPRPAPRGETPAPRPKPQG